MRKRKSYVEYHRDEKLPTVDDLHEKIREEGYRIIGFSILFYISVPFFYYMAYLKWTFVDAFYVSKFFFKFCTVLILILL